VAQVWPKPQARTGPDVDQFHCTTNQLGAIKAERNRRNLKQHHLAERLGKNTSWISVIERGKRKSPLSRDEVVAIEDALEIIDSRLLLMPTIGPVGSFSCRLPAGSTAERSPTTLVSPIR